MTGRIHDWPYGLGGDVIRSPVQDVGQDGEVSCVLIVEQYGTSVLSDGGVTMRHSHAPEIATSPGLWGGGPMRAIMAIALQKGSTPLMQATYQNRIIVQL